MHSTTPPAADEAYFGNELLSEFMDGEMERKAARFFFRRLLAEPQFRACWERWHLIRAYLHDRRLVAPDSGLADRLVAVLAAEPRPLTGAGALWHRLGTVAASGAVAAAVAFVALLALRNNALEESREALPEAGGVSVAQTTIDSPTPYGDFTTRQNDLNHIYTPSLVPVGLQSEVPATPEQRLDAYLLRHSELSAGGGRIGFVSYVPIIVIDRDAARLPARPDMSAGNDAEKETAVTRRPLPAPTGQ